MSNVNIKRVKSSDIEFKDKLVSIQRVTKVTKGGRTFSFSAIVVVGDENGVVGYGLGKAKEVQAAVSKGIDDAKKNLIKVPVLHGTIPHNQLGKYSGALVYLQPAAPGTGVIAGGAVRDIMGVVGIHDIRTKCLRSNNPNNVVAATINGLKSLRTVEEVAAVRGKDPKEILG